MSKYLIPKLSRATEDCDIKFTINERIFEQIVRKKNDSKVCYDTMNHLDGLLEKLTIEILEEEK